MKIEAETSGALGQEPRAQWNFRALFSFHLLTSFTLTAGGLFPHSTHNPNLPTLQFLNNYAPLSYKIPSLGKSSQIERLGLCVILLHCIDLSFKLYTCVVPWLVYDSSMRLWTSWGQCLTHAWHSIVTHWINLGREEEEQRFSGRENNTWWGLEQRRNLTLSKQA